MSETRGTYTVGTEPAGTTTCLGCGISLDWQAVIEGYCIKCWNQGARLPATTPPLFPPAGNSASQDEPDTAIALPLSLTELVGRLRQARIDAEDAHLRLANERRLWELDHATMIEDAQQAKTLLGDLEVAVRDAALAEYAATGERHLPGVEIKVFKSLMYGAKAALDWCRAHDLFLAFDKRGFEGHAKAHPEQMGDFLVLEEEPKAMIASDLHTWRML